MRCISLKFLSLILVVVTISSCSKLNLSPLSEGNAEEWFEDLEEFQMSLNSLYDGELWEFETSDVSHNTLWNLDRQTDDWLERTVVHEVPAGTVNSDWSDVKRNWNALYKGIARANQIINNIENYDGDNIPGDISNEIIAEASFFRATFYSYLIFFWGDVPYLTENLTIEEAFEKGRDDKLEILQKIYDDYDVAAEFLPVQRDQGVTKGAAYAFKARTAIWMLDYEVAAESAQSCIDLDIYSLDPDFSRLFLLSTNESPEYIFTLPRSEKLTGLSFMIRNYLPRNVGGYGTGEPTWSLFNSFYCTDGLPIDESPLYDPQHPFENRDPRLSRTFVKFGSEHLGYIYDPSAKEVLNVNTGEMVINQDSKYATQYASFNGLLLKKYVDEDWIETFDIAPKRLLMRYADVLLMYAEAKEELNQIDNSVLDALNKVRARGYEVHYQDINSFPEITETDQSALRKIIRYERRVELAWENRRYFDLIRWGIAEEALTAPVIGIFNEDGLDENIKSGDYFFPKGVLPIIKENGVVDQTPLINTGKVRIIVPRGFVKRQYLWPLPSEEVQINSNLKQNPGY